MKLLPLLSGLIAFVLLALRVPVEGRDIGYYFEGLCILAAFGLLATDNRPR